MKKKKTTVEIVIEHPEKQSPFDYMDFKGGALVNVVSKKIIKEEELGDVDTPWGQKMREFYAVRKIIAEGVRAGLKDHYTVNVYGGTYAGLYYSLNIHAKKGGPELPEKLENRLSLNISCDKGTLTWTDRWDKVLARMSVGDPYVGVVIENFIEDLIKK